jgi:hypothetical protein
MQNFKINNLQQLTVPMKQAQVANLSFLSVVFNCNKILFIFGYIPIKNGFGKNIMKMSGAIIFL